MRMAQGKQHSFCGEAWMHSNLLTLCDDLKLSGTKAYWVLVLTIVHSIRKLVHDGIPIANTQVCLLQSKSCQLQLEKAIMAEMSK